MTGDNTEIIVEFITIGNSVKVTAICTRTGKEVSLVGDPRASKKELEALVVRKFNYVVNKEKALKTGASGTGNKGILA